MGREIAQVEEHSSCNLDVAGSIPASVVCFAHISSLTLARNQYYMRRAVQKDEFGQ